jgi:hypothetical protein
MPWTLSVDNGGAEADVDDGSSMVIGVVVVKEIENCERNVEMQVQILEFVAWRGVRVLSVTSKDGIRNKQLNESRELRVLLS